MRTFIENYLHFMKNCIRPHYEKLKPLKSGFIENSNFENNGDPSDSDNLKSKIILNKFFVFIFFCMPASCTFLQHIPPPCKLMQHKHMPWRAPYIPSNSQ